MNWYHFLGTAEVPGGGVITGFPRLTYAAEDVYLWGTKSHGRQKLMPMNEATLASQVFDQLQQAMACDPAGFTGLYRDYLADAWQALRMLREAVQQKQAEEVRAGAHRLKGSSMVLGARAVALCAAALEEMGRNADVRGASVALEQTWRALQQVEAELSNRLGAGVVPAA